MAAVEGIFIAPRSAAPMQPVASATLLAGIGLQGDRYALRTGTYSASFLREPGNNLTLCSADGVEAAMAQAEMEPLDSLGQLRRNLMVRGLSAGAVNDMVGHEVAVGADGVRLFVHRRTVPCRYREAQTKRPGLMNNLWDACGVNCEILVGGAVKVGDSVSVVPKSHQPKRANPGTKPPGFFVRPLDRTTEQAKAQKIPAWVAALMCVIDPVGFQRVEDGYNSVGAKFWTPRAYRAGILAKKLRLPLIATIGVVLMAIVAALVQMWL